VQLTPPGSECSIQIGTGTTQVTPGAYQGLYLISSDIEATRAELVDRGVDVSDRSTSDRKDRRSRAGRLQQFRRVQRPDGNGWLVQEVKQRAPGR
jgi:hypothetical protein